MSEFVHYLDPNPGGKQIVVLIHGLGSDGTSWGYQIPDLIRNNFRPIAVDVPGFGQSKCENMKWGISSAARKIHETISKISTDPYDVVGISMGGVIAQEVAFQFQKSVRKLVLVSTFACLRPRKIQNWVYLLRRYLVIRVKGVEEQAQMTANRIFPRPEQIEFRRQLISEILQSDPVIYRQAMSALALYDSRNKLKQLSIPTLVISGSRDTTVPLENQDELAAHIRSADHIVIPDGGHAVIIDQLDKFNQALMFFLLNQPTQQ
jgi:3-oxoadipate enol-lactonase